MNFYSKITFCFVLFLTPFSYALDVNLDYNANLISKITNINIQKIFEDIDLLDEIYLLNTMVFRSGKVNNIYKENANSIVYIQTDTALGSGVIINQKGDLLTNAHVISDTKEVFVVFKPIKGTNVPISIIHEAAVIKIDQRRDLALVRPLYPPDNINPISILNILKNEEDIIGSTAHCIGHPDGLTWTYTRGVISSYRSNYSWPYLSENFLTNIEDMSDDEISKELELQKMHNANVIQTDCAINPGNSGGALINDEGKLVGINTFKDIENELVNFAVAANELTDFLNSDKFVEIESLADVILREEGNAIYIRGQDNDNDGFAEKQYWDTNKNKIYDVILIDTDGDKKANIAERDINENGKIDSKILYLDNQNEHYFDIDENGIFDHLFIDIDKDGNFEIKKKL